MNTDQTRLDQASKYIKYDILADQLLNFELVNQTRPELLVLVKTLQELRMLS